MCQALPNERHAVDLAHLVAQLEAGCVRVMVKVRDHVLVREADAKRAILAPVHVYLHDSALQYRGLAQGMAGDLAAAHYT